MACACIAISVTGCRFTAVKDEPVTLSDVTHAYVLSGGSEHVAVDGAHLRKRDRVRTTTGGTATLVVRGRRVVLGPNSEVKVPDGANVTLDKGSVLVDRRRGPSVTVNVADTIVDDVGEGAVRIERRLSVLVAALSTDARVRTATGPKLRLPTLYQVSVAGRSLPERGLPLHLRDDDWERSVIADVVADDVHLNDLADGLDSPGALAVPASFEPPPDAPPSDLLLPEAIGRAAGSDEPTRGRLVVQARRLRADGGSWGVVARLVRTTAVDVGSALADVLRLGPTPEPSQSPTSTGGPGPSPTTTSGPSGGPSPTTSKTPGPKPTDEPTDEPTDTATPGPVDVIQSIISTPPVSIGPIRL